MSARFDSRLQKVTKDKKRIIKYFRVLFADSMSSFA